MRATIIATATILILAAIMSTIHLKRIADALEVLATPIGGA